MPQIINDAVLAMLACPLCHSAIRKAGETVECLGCGRRYPMADGIPVLLRERALEAEGGRGPSVDRGEPHS